MILEKIKFARSSPNRAFSAAMRDVIAFDGDQYLSNQFVFFLDRSFDWEGGVLEAQCVATSNFTWFIKKESMYNYKILDTYTIIDIRITHGNTVWIIANGVNVLEDS